MNSEALATQPRWLPGTWALGLLDDHVRHCLLDAARSGPLAADAKLGEPGGAFRRTLRL